MIIYMKKNNYTNLIVAIIILISINNYITVNAEEDKNITILYPVENSIFTNGNNYIRWNATKNIERIRIELWYRDQFLSIVKLPTINDGQFNWILEYQDVPLNGNEYRLKLIDEHDENVYIYSDYFSIEVKKEVIIPDEPIPLPTPTTESGWISLALVGILILLIIIKRSVKKLYIYIRNIKYR